MCTFDPQKLVFTPYCYRIDKRTRDRVFDRAFVSKYKNHPKARYWQFSENLEILKKQQFEVNLSKKYILCKVLSIKLKLCTSKNLAIGMCENEKEFLGNWEKMLEKVRNCFWSLSQKIFLFQWKDPW